jgi:Coenzyme PQQ synthesis protein D (PqqD)
MGRVMRAFRLRRDEIAYSDLGEEIVILDLRSSTYFSVRRTGAHLVNALMTGASTDVLVAGLCDRYDVTEDVARTDVKTFLTVLEQRDLLEEVGAGE